MFCMLLLCSRCHVLLLLPVLLCLLLPFLLLLPCLLLLVLLLLPVLLCLLLPFLLLLVLLMLPVLLCLLLPCLLLLPYLLLLVLLLLPILLRLLLPYLQLLVLLLQPALLCLLLPCGIIISEHSIIISRLVLPVSSKAILLPWVIIPYWLRWRTVVDFIISSGLLLTVVIISTIICCRLERRSMVYAVVIAPGYHVAPCLLWIIIILKPVIIYAWASIIIPALIITIIISAPIIIIVWLVVTAIIIISVYQPIPKPNMPFFYTVVSISFNIPSFGPAGKPAFTAIIVIVDGNGIPTIIVLDRAIRIVVIKISATHVLPWYKIPAVIGDGVKTHVDAQPITQRRPAIIPIILAPAYPGACPLVTWYPHPPIHLVVLPTAVVKWCPAPVEIAYPAPAVIGIIPMPVCCVGFKRCVVIYPYPAKPCAIHPGAVRA